MSQGCSVEGQEHLIGTTHVPETTEIPTTRFTINTPKPQRRRRELDTGDLFFSDGSYICQILYMI